MSTGKLHIASTGEPVRHTAAAWFARLRADDVSERERSEFRRWFAEDSRHRAAYERLEALWSNVGTHADAPEIAARLHAARAQSSMAIRQRVVRRRAAWGSVAALLVVGLIAGWFAWTTGQTAPRLYSTGTGERRTLLLQDGSHVTLDTNTKLSVTFSAQKRHLTLEHGRAFFKVAKAPNRPFLVTTPYGVVRDIGTEFSVYERKNSVEVTLVEGRVTVTSDNSAGGHGTVTAMHAGQRLLIGDEYPEPVLEPARTGMDTAWLSGKLVFNDTPLSAAIAEFNRYSTSKMVIGDDGLRSIHVSGVFRADNSRAFIDALNVSYGVSAIKRGSTALILVAGPQKHEARQKAASNS